MFTKNYWIKEDKKFISENVRCVFLGKGTKTIKIIGDINSDYEFKLLDSLGYETIAISENISYTGDEFITDTMWACNCEGNQLHTRLLAECPKCGFDITNRSDDVKNFLDEHNYDNVIVVNFNCKREKKKKETKKLVDKFELGPFSK